ncbi:hypothetical protein J4E90_010860 [Alternaria incomplexa]|uniref:uncharacterized protein n=1 Tax=Alternaria incomplexa TaxID=1187928 RepID=UPI0022204ADD|nr:uncharacterized protein J4E90_010860 [Alternaria incomplexa]KAI4906097.1 hypothetical protein J4E90_010860 [Alternaria incomplexa]
MSSDIPTKPAFKARLLKLLRLCTRPAVMLPSLGIIGLILVITLTTLLPKTVHSIDIPGADTNHNYLVAVSHFPLTDSTKKDPYRPDQDRRIMVSLYMPVPRKQCSALSQQEYMPPQTAKIANEQFIEGNEREVGVFETMTYSSCVGSSSGGDVSKIPVVVLEPHVDTSRLMYSTTARYIAANGAAVVVIDHPGDASIVEFTSSRTRDLEIVYNSGTVPLCNLSPITEYNETVRTAVAARVSDIAFALGQINSTSLLTRQFPALHFTGSLNTESFGIIGHGLGGTVATSISLFHTLLSGTNSTNSTNSPRASFSINLSGTPPLLNSSTNNSPLFFFGRADFRREHDINWPVTWSHLTGPATEFDLDNSAIFDASDLPLVVELAREEGGKTGLVGRGLSGGNPAEGARAVICFLKNIVKEMVGLEGQGRNVGDCIRMFEGVRPYPGYGRGRGR